MVNRTSGILKKKQWSLLHLKYGGFFIPSLSKYFGENHDILVQDMLRKHPGLNKTFLIS